MKLFLKIVCVLVFLQGCQTGKKYFNPSVKKKTLLNGVEVLTFKDEKSPFFQVMLWSSQGIRDEDSNELGVTNLLLENFSEGTIKKSKSKILEDLSSIGASLHTSVGMEQSHLTASSVVEDSEKLANLFSEIILSPSMSNKSILNIKRKVIAEIKQIPDNPGGLNSLIFKKKIYNNHPYSRFSYGSLKTVSALRKKQIQKAYGRYMNPKTMKIVLIGNWTDQAEVKLLSDFSDLEGSAHAGVHAEVDVPKVLKTRVIYHKSDLQQAYVNLGVGTLSRSHSDYVAFKTGLFILGGSFKSRLNQELRINRGLTYGVGAGLNIFAKGGDLKISGAVRHDKVKEFTVEALKIVRKTSRQGVTQQELDKAKAYIKGNFPREIETKKSEAYAYLNLVSKGVDGSELYKYLKKVENLSLRNVNDVLRKHLVPEELNLIILANKNAISSGDKRKLKIEETHSYKRLSL